MTRGFNSQISVDANLYSSYHFVVEKRGPEKLNEQELKALESRVDQLIRICENLKRENDLLKSQQKSHTTERADLISKNEQVRKRVEAMVTRLKSMEVAV